MLLQDADTQLTRGSDSRKAGYSPSSEADPVAAGNGAAAEQNGASLNGYTASENGRGTDAHRPKRCSPMPVLHC